MEVCTIGGYEEVGNNMTAVKVGEDVIIFDSGVCIPRLIELQEQEDYIKKTEDKLRKIIAEFPGIVALDETYTDFGGYSLVNSLKEHSNLIIMKSMSKFHGMAGMRLGFALANEFLISRIKELLPAFNVNIASLELAKLVLQEKEALSAIVSDIINEREKVYNRLKAIDGIIQLVDQNDVKRIVIGLPYSLDGSMGLQANKVKDFVKKFSKSTKANIEFWDERLSTVAVERLLTETGNKKAGKKMGRDATAAAFILQGYLDSLKVCDQ